MKKEFLIDYKGDFNQTETDEQTGRQFVDVLSNKYGQIKITGTDKDLNLFLLEVEKTSPNFKLIGVTDLSEVIAIIDVHEGKAISDSIFSIRSDHDSEQIGTATVSSIVQLIKDSGDDESEVIRFLTTAGEFRTWINKQDLQKYIQKNILK
jgi:hypothetical protein